MNSYKFFRYLLLAIFLTSCSPKIVPFISDLQPPLEYQEEVALLFFGSKIPERAKLLGTVKIGESGFTVKCNFDYVVDLAKLEARKCGGNLIRIIEHREPDLWSSCHRIIVEVYKTENN